MCCGKAPYAPANGGGHYGIPDMPIPGGYIPGGCIPGGYIPGGCIPGGYIPGG